MQVLWSLNYENLEIRIIINYASKILVHFFFASFLKKCSKDFLSFSFAPQNWYTTGLFTFIYLILEEECFLLVLEHFNLKFTL